MQVQQGLNNQPSFGMGFKVTRQAVKIMKENEIYNEFLAAKPLIKPMGEGIDLKLVKDPVGLSFVATPKNLFGISNSFTRNIYRVNELLITARIALNKPKYIKHISADSFVERATTARDKFNKDKTIQCYEKQHRKKVG